MLREGYWSIIGCGIGGSELTRGFVQRVERNGASDELPGGGACGRVVQEAVSAGIEGFAQGVATARQQARAVVRAGAARGQRLEGDHSGGRGRRRCALRRKLGCGRRP